MEKPIEFGTYIHGLRKEKKYSLKIVADKLGVDISLLSKIENGERQLQSHMLNGLSELFDLDYKDNASTNNVKFYFVKPMLMKKPEDRSRIPGSVF